MYIKLSIVYIETLDLRKEDTIKFFTAIWVVKQAIIDVLLRMVYCY